MYFRIRSLGLPRWRCLISSIPCRSPDGPYTAIGVSGWGTRSSPSFRSSHLLCTGFCANRTFNTMARSISLREPALASPLRNVRLLSLHRFIFRFAFAGANIFAWIFIIQYFYLVEPSIGMGLERTALLYALSHTVTCLATPYAARLLRSGSPRGGAAGLAPPPRAFFLAGRGC